MTDKIEEAFERLDAEIHAVMMGEVDDISEARALIQTIQDEMKRLREAWATHYGTVASLRSQLTETRDQLEKAKAALERIAAEPEHQGQGRVRTSGALPSLQSIARNAISDLSRETEDA